jgi:predicted Zn-dependent protease
MEKTANDDELAGVLAHEVAHIVARHAVKRYEGSLGLQAAQLLTLAARQGELARGLGVAGLSAQLAYARQDELEADQLAVKYLRAAGFDPIGILTFLETLRELDREHTAYLPRGVVRPHYGRTHPFIPERLRAVKEELYGVAEYLDYLNTPD